MPAAYLTTQQATTRLAAYEIQAAPSEVELRIASDDLDLREGPFVADRLGPAQVREFPRSATVRDDVAGSVPAQVLDWVALRAYQLSEDDEPAVLSEKVSSISVRYARGKKGRVERLMANLLRPYRARRARSVRIV